MSYPRARPEEGAEPPESTKASSRLHAGPPVAGTPGGPGPTEASSSKGTGDELEGGPHPGSGGHRRRFHLPMVLLWLALGTLIALTSVLALQLGVEALYLVVTGWVVGPFFIYWIFRKIRAGVGR